MLKATTSDFLVVGGGIVGLATAWHLTQCFPDARICLLEKEPQVAQHQSGRNSGVLHSGIYYKPGSLKATTCRSGSMAMQEFCQSEQIRYEICGKIIVAVSPDEVARLDAIHARGLENGIHCRMIDAQEMRHIEPHVAGVKAVYVPEAGIVDYPGVCQRLAQKLTQAGHQVLFNQQVVGIEPQSQQVVVRTPRDTFPTGFLVTCGGLYSDRLARMAGLKPPAQIVPFRGEYFELRAERRKLCRNLIYPVPDPSFPFLGVHFTRMVSGDVECGPNAVFALAREGYSWRSVRLGELAESLSYGGFLKLAARHWRMGLGEIHRSLSKAAFVKALQRLIPEIQSRDLRPCRAGVRAQALAPDGTMIDDFLWVAQGRMIHVCNAPSPAATAALEIGRQISQRVTQSL
ncbi:MAG: L-2-hydroxyglutarate oxidase [Pirellulaceae bacterium]|jgi:L-2-hydroxyglutarate oxidase|nr:L-2-hydroxyglutarate oxidase [Pirellulaceae bacterium]